MTKRQKNSVQALRTIGWTYAKIAETIGIPMDTVKSFCYRQKVAIQKTHDADGNPLCRHCSKRLYQNTRGRSRSFCNDRCRYEWWNRYRPLLGSESTVTLTCHRCKSQFSAYAFQNRKYCSVDCYTRAQRDKREGAYR